MRARRCVAPTPTTGKAGAAEPAARSTSSRWGSRAPPRSARRAASSPPAPRARLRADRATVRRGLRWRPRTASARATPGGNRPRRCGSRIDRACAAAAGSRSPGNQALASPSPQLPAQRRRSPPRPRRRPRAGAPARAPGRAPADHSPGEAEAGSARGPSTWRHCTLRHADRVLRVTDRRAIKTLWIGAGGRKLRRMKLFGTKSGRPVVPWKMLRLPEVPRRVRIAAWCAAALFAAAAAGIGIIAFGCPPVSALRDYKAPQASLVFDRDNKLLARLAPEERIVVPLSSMSPKLVAAFLAVEDNRFYDHSGIDWRRVVGAIWRDFRTLSLREGSSTITMQLARNVFPDSLTRARTLRRKLAEMIVARRIEREFNKQQILEMYLNQIYLGNGYYGVEAAARGYFGGTAMDLTISQAALLAALPKAPSTYDPRRFPDVALKRRNLVLGQMAKAKAITAKDEALAKKSKLRLSPQEQEGGAPWFVAAFRSPPSSTRHSFRRTTLRRTDRSPAIAP